MTSLGLGGTSGGPPPLGSLNLNLNQNTDTNKKSTNTGDSDKLFSQINVGMDDIKKRKIIFLYIFLINKLIFIKFYRIYFCRLKKNQ